MLLVAIAITIAGALWLGEANGGGASRSTSPGSAP